MANDLEKVIQQGGDATPPLKEPQMDIRSAAASQRSCTKNFFPLNVLKCNVLNRHY